MKYLKHFFLVVITFALLPNVCKALSIDRLEKEPILLATKEKKVIQYRIGKYVSIFYGVESRKVNGRLVAIKNDSIFLQPLNKKQNIISIATSDIHSIMKLHKKGRKGWITILSILVAMTIFGIILLNSNSFLAFLALAMPVVSLYTFLPFLLGSFLADLLSKKSAKKGWTFSTKI